jgi:hypothetical protein
MAERKLIYHTFVEVGDREMGRSACRFREKVTKIEQLVKKIIN